MKVSQFYDMVGKLIYAIDTNRATKVDSLCQRLRDELARIEARKRNGYKLPWLYQNSRQPLSPYTPHGSAEQLNPYNQPKTDK